MAQKCLLQHDNTANLSCEQAIEGMIEDAKAAGLPPVMSAYTSLINAYGARSSLPEVRRVMLEMKEDGVEANRLHYKAAIHAHGQAGRPTEAQVTMLTEMSGMTTQL